VLSNIRSQEIRHLVDSDHEIYTGPDTTEGSYPLSTIKGREASPETSEKDVETIKILGVDEKLDGSALFSNLQTRKRQEPHPSTNGISPTSGRPSVTELDETISPKRVGHKRKFGADREDEYLSTSIADDDFQYSRPRHSSLGKDEERVSTRKRNSLLREDSQSNRDSSTHKATQRKALEPSMETLLWFENSMSGLLTV
jgi:hypothetical protein